jgi:hypothetical protein
MPEVEQTVSMQQLDGKICEMFPLLKIGCAQLTDYHFGGCMLSHCKADTHKLVAS